MNVNVPSQSALSQLRESSAILSSLVPTPWNPRHSQYGIFQNASLVGLDDKRARPSTSHGAISLSGHHTHLTSILGRVFCMVQKNGVGTGIMSSVERFFSHIPRLWRPGAEHRRS